MVNIVYGALGVIAVLGLLGLGFFMGWNARVKWVDHTTRAVSVEINEQQKRDLEAQQRAFETMMSYNQEVAYGETKGLAELMKEGGTE